MAQPALILFEDDHLLVVNKPAGMNTHAPSPHAGEGLYEWLKHREPRWAKLAIIHRLDKETSGVIVFGKTAEANRSLTAQFTQHSIRKTYQLLTDRAVKFHRLTVTSALVRVGEKYSSRPLHAGVERAKTHFRVVRAGEKDARAIDSVRHPLIPSFSPTEGEGARRADEGVAAPCTTLEAEPITGRTHQIRVQAAAEGFPILGDVLYGGTAASRVCLHAAALTLKHPASGAEMKFTAPADFAADTRMALRAALIDERETNACRLIHGAADGWPGWYVERLGDYLLSQSEQPPAPAQLTELQRLMTLCGSRGAYHKTLTKQIHRASAPQVSPRLILGEAAPEIFVIRENGAQFELSFKEGYSVGLFLDQRENRRRILTNHVAADFPLFAAGAAGAEVLNTFAYTCGFSVCAAQAGARVTSLDLSRKYLDWGRRNFALNQIDPAAHDFIFGDAFDWFKRLAKKGRAYDLVLLDPPTFSHSKAVGTFRAEKDFGRLLDCALPLLKPGGVLFASTNAARLEPETFLEVLATSVKSAGRKILRQHYVPQPPDFPVHRLEPAYLKTLWAQVA